MDRFIVWYIIIIISYWGDLKSNMDRFIVNDNVNGYAGIKFKIQYGQIYREQSHSRFNQVRDLKSNMDRFIGD